MAESPPLNRNRNPHLRLLPNRLLHQLQHPVGSPGVTRARGGDAWCGTGKTMKASLRSAQPLPSHILLSSNDNK